MYALVLFFIFAIYLKTSVIALDGLELCQSNCVSSDRLTGPTRMPKTRQHPWKIAQYPTKTDAFCKFGCRMFYTEFPTNFTCKKACDYTYRYRVTAGYSDIAEESILECRDGCEIALQICQAGYYCTEGVMTACPAGRYREAVTDVSIVALDKANSCIDCPFGRYRPQIKGKSAEDCNLCPIGKYANVTGSVKVSDCQRCPAGKHAEQEGMQLCKCITKESCDLEITVDEHIDVFFKNKVDYFRESVPYIGRW